MIMATSTAYGHGEKRTADGFDLFIHYLHPEQFLVLQLIIVWTKREKPGRHKAFVLLYRCSFGQQVPSDLLKNELVKWFITIERINNVIPVTPSISEHQATTSSTALSKPGHVQPVPTPFFTELR